MNTKQRQALEALRDVVEKYDIHIGPYPHEGCIQVSTGVDAIHETWSNGCIDALNLTNLLEKEPADLLEQDND